MSTWQSAVKPVKKHSPSAHKRGLELLWAQHGLHKRSHFLELKFPKWPSLNKDRCSPDVSWTFEHRSCSPCPQLPQLTWLGEACSSLPSLSQQWLWLPPGTAPTGVHQTLTQLWPTRGSPVPAPPPPNRHPGFPGSSSVLPLSQRPVPLHSLAPTPCAGEWILLEIHSVIITTVFLCKIVVSKLSACDFCSSLCAHFLLHFQVVNPAESQAHLWDLLI